ncbi:glycosyltransferase [Oenococcus oeni]|uniref:glycosyltransferase n=1 Tax=Oenococcus oeni TaxID=1247 RepID=UPI00067D12B6|nr:glycosyltransferase [Oenococcus oeni]OIM54908.1 hypothetical protein ATX80_07150 [Oenococcus oeni]
MNQQNFKKEKPRILAVIVTYNPNIGLLIRNIRAIKSNLNNNYLVVDNGSHNFNDISNIVESSHIIKLSKNLGIAAAQNKGFAYGNNHFYDWILTLDQDSKIPENFIRRIYALPEFYKKNTGIIGSNFTNSFFKMSNKKGLIKQSRIDTIIASGSLININAWKWVEGFDESLFIDCVDFDFNAKLKISGFSLFKNYDILIKHEIGQVVYAPILGPLLFPNNKPKYFSDHSYTRLYFIYRNSVIIKKRYPQFFINDKNPVYSNFKKSREIIVFSHPRIKKFFFAFKGTLDSSFYKPEKDLEFQKVIRRICHEN